MSLRDHWTVEPRIGDLYSTPICYLSEGCQKDIEQIGCPYKENLHHLISDSSAPINTKQLTTLTLYKRFLNKCKRKLAKVKSHVPDFPALEVVGTRLLATCMTGAKEETRPCNLGLVMSQDNNVKAAECGWDEPNYGPRAELSLTKLFLHGKPGEHISSLVTLHNTGCTSLHYQWQRQPPISFTVQINHMGQPGDHARGASCFYIVPIAGCIVPGESKDFYIEFHPIFSGSFMETWILGSTPKLSTPIQALHLHGAAAAPEDENSVLQRKLLQQTLEIRQRTRGLGEIFCEIEENVIKQAHITFKKAPDFVVSSESFDFIRGNIESYNQTPLYYSPPLLLQFQNLAVEIHKRTQENIAVNSSNSEAGSSSMADTAPTWDMSVSNLVLSLDGIDADENWKETMKLRISYLELLAAIPPHPSAILYASMYKTLAKIVTQIEEAMEERDGQNISEESNTNESETVSDLDADSVKGSSPSKQAFADARVGQVDTVRSFGSSSTFTNASVEQGHYAKSFSSIPSKQASTNANLGQIDPLKSMGSNPSKQVLANVTVGQEKPEEAQVSELEETIITCADRVRRLLWNGVVEEFLNGVEGALAKLVPVVQKKIECCMAEGDEDSASWLSLWFSRLSHALAH